MKARTWHVGIAAALLLSGCAILRAAPAALSGFLPHDELLMENRERAPFHGLYFPNVSRFDLAQSRYRKVFLAPVELGPLRSDLSRRMFSSEDLTERIEEAQALADYFHNRFRMELEGRGFMVVEIPSSDSFTWELAIVELEPSAAAVNVAATAAGFFVPGTGIIKQFTKGSVAVEAILRDGGDGSVLGEFRDRESDKAALLTVKDFQRYSHTRTALDEWAIQFAEVSSTPSSTQVADALPIEISPF